jgi:hypothetical protein
MERDPLDPKGLIREAYRIDGIDKSECRSIFLDWALTVEAGNHHGAISDLVARHGPAHPDHPMTRVLREGLQRAEAPRRRGGWRGRQRG